MKLNPLKLNPLKLNLLKSDHLKFDHLKLELLKLNPFRSLPKQDPVGGDLAAYDESILQQSRFWMRTVTWTMIGTTVFGVAWLALAKTEEIVVAPGQLEPIGSVQDSKCLLGVWRIKSSLLKETL